MRSRTLQILVAVAACVILAGLPLASAAYAQAAAKIGFIDIRQIVATSDMGKQASADFKKVWEKKKVVIDKTEAELRKMKEAIEKQRSVLKEEAMKEKELEYQKHLREYQRLVTDSNEEMALRDQQLSQKLFPEIMKYVNAFGEKEGYTMIIDVNNPGIYFHSKANDLTKRIVAELNKRKK